MKFMAVGDLHLYDKELTTTKGLKENNIVMLEGIYNYLVANEDIKLCIFEGDIQHHTPYSKSSLYEVSRWKHWLRKIGNLMTERQPKLIVLGRDDVPTEHLHPMPSSSFTLKGNHDYSTNFRSTDSKVQYTLFDDLLYEGIFQNPQGIIFKDSGKLYYIQFNNYGDADSPLPKEIADKDDITVIKMFHDTIDVPKQGAWVKLGAPDSYYKGSKVLAGCDLGITGHIHTPLPVSKIKTVDGNVAAFVQTGSMGRTSASESHMRDFGFCTIVDTSDGLKVTELQIPLVPVDDYYDWAKIMINTQEKNALKTRKDFNISLGDYKRTSYDPKDDINKMEVSDEVKHNCITILDSVAVKDNEIQEEN